MELENEDLEDTIVTQSKAVGLPEGWIWHDYEDGGFLSSPTGKSYFLFDSQTNEVQDLAGNWVSGDAFAMREKLEATMREELRIIEAASRMRADHPDIEILFGTTGASGRNRYFTVDKPFCALGECVTMDSALFNEWYERGMAAEREWFSPHTTSRYEFADMIKTAIELRNPTFVFEHETFDVLQASESGSINVAQPIWVSQLDQKARLGLRLALERMGVGSETASRVLDSKIEDIEKVVEADIHAWRRVAELDFEIGLSTGFGDIDGARAAEAELTALLDRIAVKTPQIKEMVASSYIRQGETIFDDRSKNLISVDEYYDAMGRLADDLSDEKVIGEDDYYDALAKIDAYIDEQLNKEQDLSGKDFYKLLETAEAAAKAESVHDEPHETRDRQQR